MCGSFPPSGGEPPRAMFISLATCLFIVSFIVLLVTAFVFCCRRRRRDSTGSESDYSARAGRSGARCGDPFLAEMTLPAFSYARHQDSEGSGGGGGRPECAVCLGAVQEGEMVQRLPVCMHLYHVECIDRWWLAAHRTCPLCRSELHPLPPAQEDTPDHQVPV